MFGHDNNGQQDDQIQNQQLVSDPLAADLGSGTTDDSTPGAPPTVDDAAAKTDDAPQADTPSVEEQASSFTMADAPQSTQSAPTSVATGGHDDDLLSIKQDALQQLSPLVGHLDQTPEEKFRTTMMMIQAADNQALVKDAYEAAKQITDEKVRAQALLDIVNEINYFTQQHSN